ncbi:MAG TPA: hypothetical protein VGW34_09870 [Allosphingosinicella sp.]|nr:hypothetical protein [Allosphingosinicella sp.]
MRIAAVCAGTLLASACSSANGEAEDAVRQQLTDPSSAEFRNVVARDSGATCGEVNSKNKMGGYDGFRRFIYDDASKSAVIDPQEYLSQEAKDVFGEVANLVTDTAAFDLQWTRKCAN